MTQALEQQVRQGRTSRCCASSWSDRASAQELRQRAVLAVLFSTLMMGAYIWFRFELRFGVGAAVALVHDVLIAVGALSLFNYEIDLTVVAALLTVVGFSVNDTVIVSDRIRENMRKSRRDPLATIINRSINETLSRTILTTGTAILVIAGAVLPRRQRHPRLRLHAADRLHRRHVLVDLHRQPDRAVDGTRHRHGAGADGAHEAALEPGSESA